MEGLHSTIDSEADLVAAVKQAQHAAERPSSWLAPPRRSSAPATGAASGKAAAAVKSHVSGGDFDLIAAVMGSSAAAASVLESSAALYSQACSSASSSVPQQAPMKAMAQHEGSPAAPSLHRESAANRTEASRQDKADTVMLTKQECCQAAAAETTSAGLGASVPLSPSPGAKPLFKQASAQLAASSRPRVAPTLQELAAGALPAEPSLVPASPLSVFTGAPAVPGPPSVPAPPAVAIPLASLAGLGDVMEGLRSDIGRMEHGWQERWSAQQASTADLSRHVESLHADSASQAQETTGRLQSIAAELEAQRCRLHAVEAQQAQQAQPACASPARATAPVAPHDQDGQATHRTSAAAAAACPSARPSTSGLSGATLGDIMCRLSLLESYLGPQLQQMEAASMPSGPRSAPTSPLKSRPGAGGASASASPRRFPVRRTDSRAVQAAAVAAALVYGAGGAQGSNFQAADLQGNSKDSEVAQLDSAKCASRQVARPGSSCLLAGMLNRPASAGAACCDCRAGQGSGMRSAGTSCDPASKRSGAVEMQVAETHAIIAGIQNQIAAIMGSLAKSGEELDARRQAANVTALRLEQLERTDRQLARVEAANLAGTCALERRVRGLEEAVAAAGRQAAAAGALARETSAALRVLEWRVDQSADATLGTFKALEARVDKHRSELGAVAATATLADAKTATLAAEVGRLQRRVHGASPCGSKHAATFRVF